MLDWGWLGALGWSMLSVGLQCWLRDGSRPMSRMISHWGLLAAFFSFLPANLPDVAWEKRR